MFDAAGNLRALDTIREEIIALDARGFDESRQVIAYCTRGVRASFATAAFTGAGFNVTLYEGVTDRTVYPLACHTSGDWCSACKCLWLHEWGGGEQCMHVLGTVGQQRSSKV